MPLMLNVVVLTIAVRVQADVRVALGVVVSAVADSSVCGVTAAPHDTFMDATHSSEKCVCVCVCVVIASGNRLRSTCTHCACAIRCGGAGAAGSTATTSHCTGRSSSP
jgi:hypothetical protein